MTIAAVLKRLLERMRRSLTPNAARALLATEGRLTATERSKYEVVGGVMLTMSRELNHEVEGCLRRCDLGGVTS